MNLSGFFAITFLCVFVNTSELFEKTNPNDWKEFQEKNYSIKYPEDWELDTSRQGGSIFFLLSKQTSEQDQFRENVNLIVQDLTGHNIDLDKYVQISEEQIKTLITNSNLLESKRINKDGAKIHQVVYTGDQGVFKLKYKQHYFIKDDKAYVLTLTCESDQFEQYISTGGKILNSFRLK
jgi:hypothetical protein